MAAMAEATVAGRLVQDEAGAEMAERPLDPAEAFAAAAAGPRFEPATAAAAGADAKGFRAEYRRLPVPSHRYTPLKESWLALYGPLTEQLKLDVRMNLHTRKVELKTTPDTPDPPAALQKGADFVEAFLKGFDVADAVALLRLEDIYMESFQVKDVKTLRGEHLSRAIVVADTHIHMLGSFANIKIAREAVCSLILGSPPGKVYSKLRTVMARMSER
eukprot:jgi/Chlat1/957/Chrsp108S01431